MLDVMRKHSNSWLTVFVFGIIIFVFAINFGPWRGGETHSASSYAALVNGEIISMAEFQMAYQSRFYQMQQFRADYTKEQADQDGLKYRVLEKLIEQELLAQVARHSDLSIPDEALANIIQERLFENRPFNRDEYRRLVHGVFHTTENQFENQLRRERLAEEAVNLIHPLAFVSEDEIKQSFNNKYHRISLNLFRIPYAFFKVEAATQEQIQDLIASQPEKIEDHYNKNIMTYRSKPQIKASQIMLPISKQSSDLARLKAKMEDIRLRLVEKKEDFAQIALQFSKGPTASQGGSLGTVSQGTLEPELDKALFQLIEGTISPVIQTKTGFYLLKAEEILLPTHQRIEDVQTEIAKTLIEGSKQKDLAQAYANRILKDLTQGIKGKQIKLPHTPNAPTLENTGWIRKDSRFVKGLGNAPELIKKAFTLTKNDPVLKETPDLNDALWVISLDGFETPNWSKLEDEKDAIQNSLKWMKQNDWIESYISYLKKKATIQKAPLFS